MTLHYKMRHLSCYKKRQIFTTKFIRGFYYKMRKFYYKMQVITKCDAYSKMRRYNILLNQLQAKPITSSLSDIEFNCLMDHKRRNSDRGKCSEACSEPIQTLLLTIFAEISILDIWPVCQYASEVVITGNQQRRKKLLKIEFRVSQNTIGVINTRVNELSSLKNFLWTGYV